MADDLSKGVRRIRPQAEIGLEDPFGEGFGPGGPSRDALTEIIAGAANRMPYKAAYANGGRFGEYDPRYFSPERDALNSDDGLELAWKHRLNPNEGYVGEIPAEADPSLMYRGLSHAEFEDIMRTGQIQSKGDYNIGDAQKGLTYFGTDPQTAQSYANSFAPAQHKPTFDQPGYVIAAKRPTADRLRHVEGTGSNEIGVHGPLSAEDIAAVFRGRVAARDPGVREGNGFGLAPSSRLHWEQIDPFKRGR
jgi:hypothetical protein